jgi:choline-sulfatase
LSFGVLVLPTSLLVRGSAVLYVAGLAGGTALGLAEAGVLRLGPRARAGIWGSSLASLGLFIGVRLGALEKLRGPYAHLAIGALIAGCAAGLVAGSLVWATSPDAEGRVPALRLSTPWAIATAALLAAIGCGTAIVDEHLGWLGAYPLARTSLLCFGWLCISSGAKALLWRVQWSRTIRSSVATAGVLLAAIGGWTAGSARPDDLTPIAAWGPTQQALLFLQGFTDLDRDGASSFFAGGDCAAFDRNIHPRAKEIAGNGVDDNCRYGDARASPSAVVLEPGEARGPPAVNVLLITVDSLRADHTTVYGYGRDTTPNMAAFAREARVFENAYTTGGWTGIALPSMLSGVYARRFTWAHFAVPNVRAKPGDEARKRYFMLDRPADPARWTIAGALRRRGYITAAVLSSGIKNFFEGVRKDFDPAVLVAEEMDSAVTASALEQLSKFRDRAFFLWVHYYDPHDPQQRHEGLPTFGDTAIDGYDHDILSTDREMARLLGGTRSTSERPTVVIVASDHGEVVRERYQSHGLDLNEGSIRIPLLLKGPGIAPGRVRAAAGLVDIAKTILAVTNTPSPAGLDGSDLRALQNDRAVLTDLWRQDRDRSVFLDQIVASNADFHLTYDRLMNRTFLTRARDMGAPPKELAVAHPSQLSEPLGAYLESATGGP